MTRAPHFFVAITLLFSALTLSACASKSEPESVATPAPVEVVAEKPAAPEVTPEPVPEVVPEPAPAQLAVAEQPKVNTQAAPKKKIKQAKKIVVQAPAPEPVAEKPAPVVEYKAPVVVPPEPTPPVVITPPAPIIVEPGFLEQYWLWLVGLFIIIAGIIVWWKKNTE